ncbi:hypothetical protein [Tabrizicola sp.]|uniref:hypothetical protein n=1 Tax=Tabrizicola sp. TaxID=2005166 RepID=UPI0035B43530
MLPAQFVNQLVSGFAGAGAPTRIQNDDLAFHLCTAPAVHIPLWSRLVPAGVRRWLDDRAVKRRQERDFIALWETSPHLLKDIGVLLTEATDLPDDLVAAPAKVIEHVNALEAAQATEARVQLPPETPKPARKKPYIGPILSGSYAPAVQGAV